jgi:hypothetical protein
MMEMGYLGEMRNGGVFEYGKHLNDFQGNDVTAFMVRRCRTDRNSVPVLNGIAGPAVIGDVPSAAIVSCLRSRKSNTCLESQRAKKRHDRLGCSRSTGREPWRKELWVGISCEFMECVWNIATAIGTAPLGNNSTGC